MSNSCTRAAMVPISRRVRAYFAPVNRLSQSPAIFDPAKVGMFELAAPPAPWIDLGWIDNFERYSGSNTETVRSGPSSGASLQYRSSLDANVEFDFREWGKLQMALAGGVQHMNVLATDPNADPQPLGGTPIGAVAVLAGSTATEIQVGAGAVNGFAQGDLIAVDIDYTQQTGYVGSGVAGAFVRNPGDVLMDPNYIRRITFNIGRVAGTTATSVLLEQALLGGTPANGAAVQRVVAFADREGGAFFQEWSAVFVLEEQTGGRICFYYPRLSPSTPSVKGPSGFQREKRIDISEPIAAMALHGAFVALPYSDQNDGEVAICYRSYFPATGAALY
jgi:hypothetical protein